MQCADLEDLRRRRQEARWREGRTAVQREQAGGEGGEEQLPSYQAAGKDVVLQGPGPVVEPPLPALVRDTVMPPGYDG